MWKCLLIVIAVILITGCEEGGSDLAPVVEGTWSSAGPAPRYYRVRAGDTLYSIAFRYDQDYRRLAAMNHMASPYMVKVGQVISLRGSSNSATRSRPMLYTAPPISQQWHSVPPSSPTRPYLSNTTHWLWPARGPILSGFAPGLGRKGIDIAGKRGQTILAAANGTVAYAGDGLPGYGNLILIQHPKQLLSAYGYNSKNLVRAGQTVHAGQAIAIIGASPQRRYATHFEVRKAGRPVNPIYFLR